MSTGIPDNWVEIHKTAMVMLHAHSDLYDLIGWFDSRTELSEFIWFFNEWWRWRGQLHPMDPRKYPLQDFRQAFTDKYTKPIMEVFTQIGFPPTFGPSTKAQLKAMEKS